MGLEPFLFLIGYLFVLLVAVVLFWTAGLSFTKPSIPMLFIVSYLVFSYLGTPILFFGWDREALALEAVEPALTWATWAYSGAALVLMCLGFVYARFILRLRPRRTPLEAGHIDIPMNRVLLVVAICLIALWLYAVAVQTIPLLALLQGENTDLLREARSAATNAFRQSWRYLMFGDHVAPFLSYALLSAYLTRKRLKYLFGFFLAAAIAAFSANMNLLRGNFVYYLASLVFLYYLIQRKRISLRTGILYTVIAGVVVVGMILAISRTVLDSAIVGAFDRIFDGYLITSYYYLKIFPVFQPYLFGQSFPNPGGLLPFVNFPLTVYVSQFIFGEISGVVGSAPAPFWAEMYANFGPAGALLVSFLFGVALWVLHVWTTTWPRSPIHDGLITYLAFFIRPASTSSLSAFFFPVEAIVVILVALFLQNRLWSSRASLHPARHQPLEASPQG